MRFTVSTNAAARVRGSGYDDGRAGKPSAPPQDAALRPVYLAAYRRGTEARRAAQVPS